MGYVFTPPYASLHSNDSVNGLRVSAIIGLDHRLTY